jgi:hypothetical protein
MGTTRPYSTMTSSIGHSTIIRSPV